MQQFVKVQVIYLHKAQLQFTINLRSKRFFRMLLKFSYRQ